MRVGIVCPYSFDAPGGVQFHVRDLAEALRAGGHEVSVLAPADEDTEVPDVVTPAGRAVPVRYNGSVARLAFGPRAAARVRRWIDAGRFDVLHLHEPMTPSLSMLALWVADGPVVATFHTSQVRSRALQIAHPLLRQSLEKISARIAVSEDARRTLIDHLGGDAVVVPNGVYVDHFDVPPAPRWQGTPEAPTVAFLGRLDEPRKGLQVLAAAAPRILAEVPGTRFLVAGRGDEGRAEAEAALGGHASSFEWLGGVSDADKATLLASADLYVAPQTGGESFGIVLVEAMSAGTGVVASDLGAFRRVLDDGTAGRLFRTGDAEDLAATVLAALADPAGTEERRERARRFVRTFDWSEVTERVLAVYEMALAASEALGDGAVHEDLLAGRPPWLLGRGPRTRGGVDR
ncbi:MULTISPECIES: glycosyltransferase family 4 protein [unclassified Isoptericola]|uniref:glycosyltransferase family 4 protein n=1 Tax=unclassified Isoptericola TaxID=2623355 RepID=UPI0027128531|nr:MULTISPECIES: glycosyltransferase family 4 protein [unclassified Isoptericola]MDO8145080.1 glycosyltransferase family 4 protein [Isoptericola sp. 178]MDO8148714.1 glycosyltransferase family 4 protein [Isoptericola sp. b515]MDO8151340.1 glycosyltransferase family 4 protein [Isoptericola sp. b408]